MLDILAYSSYGMGAKNEEGGYIINGLFPNLIKTQNVKKTAILVRIQGDDLEDAKAQLKSQSFTYLQSGQTRSEDCPFLKLTDTQKEKILGAIPDVLKPQGYKFGEFA